MPGVPTGKSAFRPVAALRHVLRSAFGHLPFAASVSWPWMVFILTLQALVVWLFPDLPVVTLAVLTPDDLKTLPPEMLIVLVVTFTANLFAFCSIAVNWHRFMLLGEWAQGWDRMRLDGTVMSYLGNALLAQLICVGIVVATIIATLLLSLVLALVLPKAAWMTAVAIAWALAIGWCAVAGQRLFLKLPAIAIERPDYGFRDAWDDTRGHGSGLFAFILMLLVLVFLAGFASGFAGALVSRGFEPAGATGRLVLALAQCAATWMALIVGVTALTTLYGILGEGREV